ncbi:MAG: tRNA pseudouridine(38-40) synthase TruA [Gemmatimonadaceae bacterium]|nr:tRNA pseudouridine(38-40) synthase TruA [Gemmatimonadaceae bacterium]
MSVRTLQLVLHYDGTAFSGWQVQPEQRTVQGEVERVLARLCGERIVAQGAGRTDAGVHARGQAVGVRVPDKWSAPELRRAMNALLSDDVWVAAVHEMRPEFHARYSATARRYAYFVGTDEEARSPFRRRTEWALRPPLDRGALDAAARDIVGDHCFVAFAVRGTAPDHDHHRCIVTDACWSDRQGGLTFHVEANRFLHHMVRFLVATMIDIATGKRPASDLRMLLADTSNDRTSPPAPSHALFLERVAYPPGLYLSPT